MTTLYKWRVYCTTDSTYEYIWTESDDEPTLCPTNTAHTIDPTKTFLIDTREPDLITIKEESIPTGGRFCTETLKINASRNTIGSNTIHWDIPISALAVNFVTGTIHKGDVLNMVVGEDTITGVLTANTSAAVTWSAQNYTSGEIVIYNHPTFGNRPYTCIKSTVGNEIPTNQTYWQRGHELSVSQTVIDNTGLGYDIKLDGSGNTDPLGIIVKIDNINKKIYVQNSLSYAFVALVTLVKQTVYHIKNFEIGEPWEYELGQSKIGGSHIPADITVKVYYQNKSTDTDKSIIGRVEYLR